MSQYSKLYEDITIPLLSKHIVNYYDPTIKYQYYNIEENVKGETNDDSDWTNDIDFEYINMNNQNNQINEIDMFEIENMEKNVWDFSKLLNELNEIEKKNKIIFLK